MRQEFDAAGQPIHVVALNAISAVEQQEELVKRCAFPLLQDTADIGIWSLHGGTKDDIYIYDALGRLVAHLPVGGEVETNLSTPEGYDAVKSAILGAFEP